VLEIEVKVPVPDLKAARDRLTALGAVLVRERHREENVLYDRADGELRAGRRALRLRTAGRKSFLTYKGAPLTSRKYKIREEFETEVKNVRQARKLLAGLGYRPVFSYRKHRTMLRIKTLMICLDETDVGTFLEFEGEREKIAKVSRQLGLAKNTWIKLDYITMLIRAGKGGSLPYSSSLSSPTTGSGSSSS
jgi:predicted adenylyl cyclase CyaB